MAQRPKKEPIRPRERKAEDDLREAPAAPEPREEYPAPHGRYEDRQLRADHRRGGYDTKS